LEHLSDIELYFTPPELVKGDEIIVAGDEFHHSVHVMRNSAGDIIFITDGKGSIFTSRISRIDNNQLSSRILERRVYENRAENIRFCVPILKNPDRLKFALEKCVELGITNFILFHSKYSVTKNLKPEKFHKTVLAAMKQSLRTFIPQISSAGFNDIIKSDGVKIIFHQNAEREFDGRCDEIKPTYFLFGPEGGFDEAEINSVEKENRFSLSTNRLRSETAIIKCASLLNLN
jgi:16S rRNA (uracil1498-N3)-methyltransferase